MLNYFIFLIMNKVQERLRQFIYEQGLTVKAFEESVGLSSGYVKNISKSLQPDKLEKIAEVYPMLNIDWLMIGRGSMYLSERIFERNESSGNVVASGDSSVAAMNSHVNTGGGQLVESLKREIELKDRMLEDKERLINVLMEGRK